MVPWWNKECDEAIRRKRRAYKKVRRMHNYPDLMEYKREQAKVKEGKKGKKATLERFL